MAETELAELYLSYRTFKCLELAGLLTVEDVRTKTDRELLLMPNFGKTSLHELRAETGPGVPDLPIVKGLNRPSQRNEAVAADRRAGMTLKEVGVKHGISVTRVGQIVIKRDRFHNQGL